MTEVDVYKSIEDCTQSLYMQSLKKLPEDVTEALQKAYLKESSSTGKNVLETIINNIKVAEEEDTLVCQDTGLPLVFIEIGREFRINIQRLKEAIRDGIKKITKEYPLRSNTLHAITRKRTSTNTGKEIPVFYTEFIPDSDQLSLTIVPKGSGSENMSFLKMCSPEGGLSAIKEFIINSVIEAGGKPCPPSVIGIGLGGSSDLCMKLSKKAIARPLATPNEELQLANLEEELLGAINKLGIGPMGLGGDTTALAVHIENADTHITMNPVGINFQCWCARRATAKIDKGGRVKHGL